MRPHALVLALCVLHAYAASIPASIPDNKDIEKKLKEVVKEVLSKDEIPPSDPELTANTDKIKDIENNLKSAKPADIPVKVVVDEIQAALKSEADKKENNEIIPESGESAEIKREEPDLKNPGKPQRTQHDSQNPEIFEDAQKVAIRNNQWKENPAYKLIQKELDSLKNAIENRIAEIDSRISVLQENYKNKPVDSEEPKLRASVREETATQPPFWQNWQSWTSNWSNQFNSLNNSINNYFSNQSAINSPGCSQTQSDEQRPPGLWQQVQQNFQNFISGGNQQQPPAGAQSDSPQPAQPNRPVIQAFQSAIQQAGSLFNRPQGNAQAGQAAQPAPAQPAQPAKPEAAQEGSNVVPKPEESQKQPDQPVTQSGPIKQFIGGSPVVQGIAGAVQRIQQSIIPNKPREEVKDAAAGDKDGQDVKGGFYPLPPKPSHGPGGSGNNNDSNSSGVEVLEVKEVKEAEIAEQPSPPKDDVKEPVIPAKEESKKD